MTDAPPPDEPEDTDESEPEAGRIAPYGFGGGHGRPVYGFPRPRRPAPEPEA
jgi:hypothetical protein